jgi:hypothetical protein
MSRRSCINGVVVVVDVNGDGDVVDPAPSTTSPSPSPSTFTSTPTIYRLAPDQGVSVYKRISMRILACSALVFLLASCGTVTAKQDAGGEPDAGGVAGSCDDCSPFATCDESSGTPVCTCNDGFEGNGLQCMDINECATDADNCSDDAMCINQIPSFTCVCNDGFIGDGVVCSPIWIEQYDDPNTNLGYWTDVVGVGSRIYFTRSTNDPAQMLFRSYDVVTGDVQDEVVSGYEPCACGYGGHFVAIGTRIYYFGNEGVSYDTVARTWTQYNNYDDGGGRRGEAAATALGPEVVTFGGRDLSSNYTTGIYTWDSTPGAQYFVDDGDLPVGFTNGMAATSNNQAYVFAGWGEAGNLRNTWSWSPTTGVIARPDQPADSPSDAVGWGNRIYVLYRDEMRVYDALTNAWLNQVYSMPPNPGQNYRLAVANDQLYVLNNYLDFSTNPPTGHVEIWRFAAP